MGEEENEDQVLRSVALQNAKSVLAARQRAEEELRAAKEELRESNQLLKNVLGSITDGFVAVDRDWRLTYVNPTGEAILRPLQKTRVSMVGQELWQEFPPLLGTPAEHHYRRSMAEQVTVSFEYFYPPLGRWFDIRAYPAKNGLSIYFRDISKRKNAEESLREQREWFQVTLGSIGDAVITADVDANVTFLNPVAERMTGWKLAEAQGQPLEKIFNIIHEGTREKAENPVREVLRDGRIVELANHTALIAKDGRETAIEDSAAPIRDADGKVTGAVMVFHDVTVRRRAEDALRESEERYRTLFNSVQVAVFVCDREARIQYFNPRAVELWGREPEAGVEQYCGSMKLFLPDGTLLPHDQSPIVEVLRTGVPVKNVEVAIERPDGSLLPVIVNFAALKDGNGAIVGAVTSFDDITERKAAEAILRRNEAELRALADSIPQLAWMAEPDGHIFWYNRGWYDYTGTTLEEMAGWGWQSVHDPKTLPQVIERWTASIQTGQPFEMEFPLRGADGRFRWFLTRVNPLRDASNRVVRWFGTNTDVDEVKRAREALRDETRILELLAHNGTEIAGKLDLQSVGQTVSDAATELSGAKFGAFYYDIINAKGGTPLNAAISGATVETLREFGLSPETALFHATFAGDTVVRSDDLTSDARFSEMLPHRELSSGGAVIRSYLAVPVISRMQVVVGAIFLAHPQPHVFTEKTERLIVGIASQAAIAIDNARLYSAAWTEIAERRRAEEQLAAARDAAEQANKTKDDFLATLSHELRTPLTPVLAILSSFGEEASVPEAFARDLETMRRNVELEARLIDDLLDLTRVSRGKLELQRERVEIGLLLENAINACVPEIKAKRLSLVLDLKAQRAISVDGARVTQVLWNLLKNSIKFTPEGGALTVRSRIVSESDAERLAVEVEDTGVGIPIDRIGRVFDAFEQGGRQITQKFGGLGLGLAISKAIAEAHRGTITAASPGVGGGSTFTLVLPLESAVGARGSMAVTPSTASQPPIPHRTLQILLVEDHADTAAVLSRVLRRAGHVVTHAATVAAAFAAAEQAMSTTGIDLVISDLGLPDGNGFDLMRGLTAKYGLRGIALSGFGMDSDREQSAAAGFSRHLTKPVNIAVMRSTIAELTQRN